jgi:hypothetical protein
VWESIESETREPVATKKDGQRGVTNTARSRVTTFPIDDSSNVPMFIGKDFLKIEVVVAENKGFLSI